MFPLEPSFETGEFLGGTDLPVAGQRAFQPLLHKRDQGLRQHFHALEYVLSGTLGHTLHLLAHAAGAPYPVVVQEPMRGHRRTRRASKYSTSADRPMISNDPHAQSGPVGIGQLQFLAGNEVDRLLFAFVDRDIRRVEISPVMGIAYGIQPAFQSWKADRSPPER